LAAGKQIRHAGPGFLKKGIKMGGYGEMSREEKKKALREMLERLNAGEEAWELKEEFRGFLEGVTAKELSLLEQELISEGMSREMLHRLCDIHIALFREQMGTTAIEVPEGHPIGILMSEHEVLLEVAERLKKLIFGIRDAGGLDKAREQVKELGSVAKHLKESESHYLREENVLFPYLEKHGITEPPAIMWMEHDKIREIKKNAVELIEKAEELDFDRFTHDLGNFSIALAEMLSSHFFKENNILFKAALDSLEQSEWLDVRKQFDELGYCCFTPEPGDFLTGGTVEEGSVEGGRVAFETGDFSMEELETVLNTLPVDITFVDSNNKVRYFNQTKERIFVRTKAVIGRTVQQCHPQKSIEAVNRIVEDFRSGKRDHADFWIEMNGRLIYIRYFAVRNSEGDYLGVLEVTQDVTGIKELEGEKRL